MRAKLVFIPIAAIAIPGGPAYAKVYLTVEQAQATLFRNATFTPDFRTLTNDQTKEIQHRSGAQVLNKQIKAWKVSTGGWFFADEVVGKHDFIPIAVGLDASGAVIGIEILEYRESYGDQVRNTAWRAQFNGKRPGEKLKLNKEIQNISGATLSCSHITEGLNRLLATYEVVLAPQR